MHICNECGSDRQRFSARRLVSDAGHYSSRVTCECGHRAAPGIHRDPNEANRLAEANWNFQAHAENLRSA